MLGPSITSYLKIRYTCDTTCIMIHLSTIKYTNIYTYHCQKWGCLQVCWQDFPRGVRRLASRVAHLAAGGPISPGVFGAKSWFLRFRQTPKKLRYKQMEIFHQCLMYTLKSLILLNVVSFYNLCKFFADKYFNRYVHCIMQNFFF